MDSEMNMDSVSEGSRRESGGGFAYDITLKPASLRSPFAEKQAHRVGTPPPTRDDLDKKLNVAEERRKREERKRQDQAARVSAKVNVVKARVAEQAENILKRSTSDLEEKDEKRRALVSAQRQRLQSHARHVELVREVVMQAQRQVRERLIAVQELKEQEKERNRTCQIKALLEKLKEHEQHVQEVRNSVEVGRAKYAEKHMERMEASLKNREELVNKTLERLQEHNIHIDLVRQKKLQIQGAQGEGDGKAL